MPRAAPARGVDDDRPPRRRRGRRRRRGLALQRFIRSGELTGTWLSGSSSNKSLQEVSKETPIIKYIIFFIIV